MILSDLFIKSLVNFQNLGGERNKEEEIMIVGKIIIFCLILLVIGIGRDFWVEGREERRDETKM